MPPAPRHPVTACRATLRSPVPGILREVRRDLEQASAERPDDWNAKRAKTRREGKEAGSLAGSCWIETRFSILSIRASMGDAESHFVSRSPRLNGLCVYHSTRIPEEDRETEFRMSVIRWAPRL